MKIIITERAFCAGDWYEPLPGPQDIERSDVAEHLIQIGAAQRYETKVEYVEEKKSALSSPVGQVSQPTIAPPRRGRPPKSSS
jgi:hypothetical protein